MQQYKRQLDELATRHETLLLKSSELEYDAITANSNREFWKNKFVNLDIKYQKLLEEQEEYDEDEQQKSNSNNESSSQFSEKTTTFTHFHGNAAASPTKSFNVNMGDDDK